MRGLVLLCLMSGVAATACAPRSAAELDLIAQARQSAAPALLPQDQLLGLTGGSAEAAGAALAAQAAALRAAAAGL